MGVDGMYEYSMWHGFVGLAFLVFFLWLVARILTKAGYSGLWCLILLVPVVNIVMIWVFAFKSWPSLREQPAAGAADSGGGESGGGESGSVVQ